MNRVTMYLHLILIDKRQSSGLKSSCLIRWISEDVTNWGTDLRDQILGPLLPAGLVVCWVYPQIQNNFTAIWKEDKISR